MTRARSPQQFKDTVVAAFVRREAQQPELVALKEEVAALKREKKQIVQENARAVRELENASAATPTRSRSSRCEMLNWRTSSADTPAMTPA